MGYEGTRGLRFGAQAGTEGAAVSRKPVVQFDVVDIRADFGRNAVGWRRYNRDPGQLRQRTKEPVRELQQDQLPAVSARGCLCADSPGATHANANPDRCGFELQNSSRSDGKTPWLH
jgi:hypothetical protein